MRTDGEKHHLREADLDEEVRAYIALAAEQKVAAGMAPTEAWRSSAAEAGGVEQVKQAVRDDMPGAARGTLAQDITFGFRQLRRNPVYAVVTVLTLALGLGALAAIGSLVDSVLLRPLPFAHQDRLVGVSGWYPKGWVQAVANRSRTLQGVMSFSVPMERNVQSTAGPERVLISSVTTNAFDVLGTSPILGSAFTPEQAIAGRDHAVLLSEEFWHQRLHADPQVLGTTLRIEGELYRVIGVMPHGLNFPDAATRLWIPVSFRPGNLIDPWAVFTDTIVGRMRPGMTPAAVQAEMRALHPQLLRLFPWPMPDRWNAEVTVVPLLAAIVGDLKPRLQILFGAAALLLLTACCNVASLLTERASRRAGEFALRSALGASRLRLLRQRLTESLLLGVLAAILAICLAELALPALRSILPQDLPRLAEVQLHWSLLLILLAVSIGLSLLFGLAPALHVQPRRLQAEMQAARVIATRQHLRLSGGLVIIQTTLAVATICMAGVLLHSLYRVLHIDPGFSTEHLLTAQVSVDAAACAGPSGQAHCAQEFQVMADHLAHRGGILDAALVSVSPVLQNDDGWAFDAEDHPRAAQQSPDQASLRIVTPNFFHVMGIPLLRGGQLPLGSDQSGPRQGLVISSTMANRLWPGADPLGKRIEPVGRELHQGVLDSNADVVVAVVGSTQHAGLGARVTDEMYEFFNPGYDLATSTLVVRTDQTPSASAETVRRVVASVDGSAAVSKIESLQSLLSQSASNARSLTILVSTFTGLTAALGIVGLYGLMTSIVSSRAREIGLRMALGAGRSAIARMVLGRGLSYAVAGGAGGMLVAVLCVRWLQGVLYATSPLDGLTFASLPMALLVITLLACVGPAWRAARIDPADTLRSE